MTDEDEVTVGSGNVYEDLGFAEAELERAKAALARRINAVIDSRGLTQSEAGAILGIDQPAVSRLARGRLSVFSIERLMQLLTRLDFDIEIRAVEKSSATAPGKIAVRDEGPSDGASALPTSIRSS